MEQDDIYNPILMVNSWEDNKIHKKNIAGFHHHFFRSRNPWLRKKPVMNFIMFCGHFPLYARRFLKFVKINKIAVVNFHYCGLSGLNISLLKVLRLFRGKLVLSFHGKDIVAAKGTRGIERMLWKILIHSADVVITCSESLKIDLVLFSPPSRKKLVCIHNGIDVPLLEKNRDESFELHPELQAKPFLLNIGTFEYKKGQDILLKAFKQITGEFQDLQLVLIGRPGQTLNQIKQLIGSLGLMHRVWVFENLAHPKISAFLEKTTVFVLPSRYEPFGIVVLEAGAYSVPVVASNVGGIGEILTHDQTGKLCEPDDVACFTKELMNLLNRPGEGARLGKNLRHHVITNFSWKKACQKYTDCTSQGISLFGSGNKSHNPVGFSGNGTDKKNPDETHQP
jgi:glycosyltransferase involved in cell wall biosynthesis